MQAIGEILKTLPFVREREERPGPDEILGDDGLLICKLCGEPRRYRRSNPFDERRLITLPCMCRCERDAEMRRIAQEEARQAQMRLERLRKLSLMNRRLQESRFERWEPGTNEKIRRLCEAYVRRWPEMLRDNRGLLFYGPPGTGKTFAAACVANALIEIGVPVMVTGFVRLMAEMDAGSGSEALDRLDGAKLLIIDDLGAERGTETATERVYSIVDTRYRQGLPLILTSNLTMEEMREADVRHRRIYDRVSEMCYPVAFEGRSRRPAVGGGAWIEELMREA